MRNTCPLTRFALPDIVAAAGDVFLPTPLLQVCPLRYRRNAYNSGMSITKERLKNNFRICYPLTQPLPRGESGQW